MEGSDVDEVERLRAALAACEAELHAARGEMSTFAATLNHDLNNTLGTIRGFAELLTEDPELDGRTRRTAERIQSSAGRSLRAVEAAVIAARSRVVATAPHRVDLAETLRSLAERRKDELDAADVTVDAPEAPIVVPGHAPKIGHLLSLVLDNVLVHAAGSTLTMASERAEGRQLVRLRDDGPGFDPRDADRVFEPGVTLRGGGDGQGLATVRRLIEEHGGRAWITTEPGEGLTVHLAFPVATTDAVDEG